MRSAQSGLHKPNRLIARKRVAVFAYLVPLVTVMLCRFPHTEANAIVGEACMAWVVLFLAGLCEVTWAVGLKYTDGFSRLWPTIGILAAMALSVALLELALRWLPLGTAYAVWTGIGTVGTALLGIALFGEPADLTRVLCISLILSGIGGLKLVS
jgi:quaternary ammonium compound-resistance protein SugE